VSDLNAIGESIGVDALCPLDPDQLVEAAVHTTGCDDFGDGRWHAGFERLCTALREEARLHATGAFLTRSEIVRSLQNRLRVVGVHARDGSIARAPVEAPWFVCGTARSGTSILHELLAQDPTTRCPAAWEVLHSVPPPAGASYGHDPRIATVDREVRLWDEICPEYLAMHENGGALPLECIFITAHEFASEHWSGVHDVPSYNRWLQRADLRAAYEWHRLHVQLLQWRAPAGQWVFKAPSHLSALPALFAVYPDAWIIQTHRDPCHTIPSTISLMATLRWMRSDHVDVGRLTAVMTAGVAALFEVVHAIRTDGTVPGERFVDVQYAGLVHDPVATIRAIYERIGRPFTADFATRIEAYVAQKPRAKHGAHRYGLEQFGIDRAALRDRYAPYCNAYMVEEEDAQ
jgi:hypothetical protein